MGYPQRAQGYRNGRGAQSEPQSDCPELTRITQGFEEEYPQKSPHSAFLRWTGEGVGFVRLRKEMAPEVGLEPTTLRLTATESVHFPTATDCYKLLPVMHLDPPSRLTIAIHMCPIMTDFEGAWAQKWAQSFGRSGVKRRVGF